ncbi:MULTISPECIES: hypothetical protein [unclassified Streptomyces]|uniref:hypothetical protein n=1 Tax=unclassified Streptomyces TaxID=2593676 RepID=UPI00131AC793|nr:MULTISPECIES: hypothetical protein [unclassified Streptomyces]
MRAQESRISVSLGDDLGRYPDEVWELELNHLDMFVEEVIDELNTVIWAEERDVPLHSTVSARTGVHNWGASGSFSEVIMQVTTGTAGGIGATAIAAAIKVVFEKLKSRAEQRVWQIRSLEEAEQLARSGLHRHYQVAVEKLTLVQSAIDAESHRYDLEFAHEDGRKFGAVVGALETTPSCLRLWADGPITRPAPEPPASGS